MTIKLIYLDRFYLFLGAFYVYFKFLKQITINFLKNKSKIKGLKKNHDIYFKYHM